MCLTRKNLSESFLHYSNLFEVAPSVYVLLANLNNYYVPTKISIFLEKQEGQSQNFHFSGFSILYREFSIADSLGL